MRNHRYDLKSDAQQEPRLRHFDSLMFAEISLLQILKRPVKADENMLLCPRG